MRLEYKLSCQKKRSIKKLINEVDLIHFDIADYLYIKFTCIKGME